MSVLSQLAAGLAGGVTAGDTAGVVIASRAEQEKNRLETGTLGWRDIHNQADFKAEHQGGSLN